MIIEGIAFDSVTEAEVVSVVREGMDSGRGGTVLTPNVDILRTLRTPSRRDLASSADLVVADGSPIVWASRLSGTPLANQIVISLPRYMRDSVATTATNSDSARIVDRLPRAM